MGRLMPRSERYAHCGADGGVTPQPVQNPIPLWLGYLGPARSWTRRSARRRAAHRERRDVAPLPRGPGQVPATNRPRVGWRAGSRAGSRTTPSATGRFVSEHLAYQVDSYRRHMVEGTDQPLPPPVDPEKLRSREPRTSIDYFYLETPDRMAERVRAYTAGAPVETVYFWASIARDVGGAGKGPRPARVQQARAAPGRAGFAEGGAECDGSSGWPGGAGDRSRSGHRPGRSVGAGEGGCGGGSGGADALEV